MLKYSDEKLAILIGVPIVTFILIWTIAIFHKNRRKWGPYDIVIVSIIVQSILRNVASVVYTSWLVVRQTNMSMEVCSGTVWIFNSVHTFQASSLTTLAVIALFSTKLETKQLSIRQYLMRTHIVYHMFCLTTLCACVGVAAILAQEIPPSSHNATSTDFNFLKDAYQNIYTQCLFMPFQLDVKYSVFILTLHVFLTVVSASCLIWVLIIVVRVRRKNFSYLKKSASDLSDLSLASMVNVNENLQGSKGTYDTYTIHKGCNIDGYGNCCENHSNGQVSNSNIGWSSDPSATVSSSNSRRPCLNEHGQRLKEEDPDGTGLQTMYPVLTVCYLFNHIPVIILCIFPWLIYPWPVAGAALWMAQLQDVLIPIGLGLVDTRFCTWVTSVYNCSDRHVEDEKLPQVGLDGKFRHFESQPQSLEINHPVPERVRAVQHTEHKFPITNGSLYTSIDGRLPIIHNYRRHKNQTGMKISTIQSANMDIHSSHLLRQEQISNPDNSPQTFHHNIPPPSNYCYRTNPNVTNHPNDDTSSNHDIRYRPSINNNKSMLQRIHRDSFILHSRPLHKRISISHDSVRNVPLMENNWPSSSSFAVQNVNRIRASGSRNSRKHGLGLDYRKSKSEDALNDLQRDLQRFKQNPAFYEANNGHNKFFRNGNVTTSDCSSDDDSFTDQGNFGQENDGGSQSGYSITTDGNCDFEFYQNDRYYQKSNRNPDDITEHSYSSYSDEFIRPAMSTFKPTRLQPQQNEKNEAQILVQGYDPDKNKNENDSNNNNNQNQIQRINGKLSRTSSKSSLKSGSFLDVRIENNNNYNIGRISRSSSKKSLENFHAYVEENIAPRIQRSNSYVSNEYKCKFNLNSFSRLSRSNSNLSDCSCVKEVKKSSVLYSPRTAYFDDLFANHGLQVYTNTLKCQNQIPNCSVSVPDFKKIFISEYL